MQNGSDQTGRSCRPGRALAGNDRRSGSKRFNRTTWTLTLGWLGAAIMLPVVTQAAPPEPLAKLQQQIRAVVEKATKATVGIQNGMAAGSGVIVTKDGYVLTAAHVMGDAKQEVIVILSDGKRVRAKPLGANRTRDAAMLKIVSGENWPYAPVGRSSDTELGQWVIAMGHPGGYEPGRTPPVRLGKIEVNTDGPFGLITDCTLIGGDSGGPLFNLKGEVIGIHSSIAASTAQNRHVPSDVFLRDWEVLQSGRRWGRLGQFVIPPGAGFLGLEATPNDNPLGMKVDSVDHDGAAERAGIEVGDVLLSIDGYPLENAFSLGESVAARRAGDTIRIRLSRDGEEQEIKVTLGARP